MLQSAATVSSLEDAAAAIVAVGRFLSSQGWVPATSGNFSHRLDDQTCAVTRSGVDKGELTDGDVIAVPLSGPIAVKTSAETELHRSLYRMGPDTNAILHTHSPAVTVYSMLREAEGCAVFAGYELQKALRGVTTHETTTVLPIFANTQDIDALAAEVEAALPHHPGAVAYMIAGHGLYAWGRTMDEARRHVVAIEFLVSCELEKWKLRP